jgi:hypothetical protein
MDVVFIQRHLPGVGIARVCLGRPVRKSNLKLAPSKDVPVRFATGQCFGVLWWMPGSDGECTRILAIGRVVDRPGSQVTLPGFSRGIEVRVLLEQTGPLGETGPLSSYLEAAEEASLLGHALPPLSVACYRRLRPTVMVTKEGMSRLFEIFDGSADDLSPTLGEAMRRLTTRRTNPAERQWHVNGDGRRSMRGTRSPCASTISNQ